MARRRKPDPPPRRRRNSGSVAAQSDGTFWAIPPAWADPGRKPRRGFPTWQAAASWLDTECVRAREQGTPSSDLTLRAYLVLWFTRIADSAGWAPSTQAVHRTRIRAFAAVADVKLRDLRPSQLQDVVAAMARRGVSPSVIRQTIGVIRRALADALDDGLVTRNVAGRIVLPKARAASPRAWSRVEARRLLVAVEGEPLELLVLAGMVCAMRIGELLGLQWDDIDMEARTLTVRRSFSAGAVGPPKTRRERTIRLPEIVWAAIERHREQHPGGSGWLFESERHPGTPVSYTYAGRWLGRMVEQAGIRPLGTHALRHSGATAMLSGGVLPPDAAQQLGHANPGTTLDTYWSPTSGAENPSDVVVRWLAGDDSERAS